LVFVVVVSFVFVLRRVPNIACVPRLSCLDFPFDSL
jgi:hypothetical protein